MLRRMLIPALFATLCAVTAGAQEPLTNDTVIKMVKAGLSADVIVSMVKTQPAKYTLTPDQLIVLKSAGVPDQVVAAMLDKTSAPAAARHRGHAAGGNRSRRRSRRSRVSPTIPASTSTPRTRNGAYKMIELDRPPTRARRPAASLPPPSLMGLRRPK